MGTTYPKLDLNDNLLDPQSPLNPQGTANSGYINNLDFDTYYSDVSAQTIKNTFQITKIFYGTYVMTPTDLSNQYANISFGHFLGYAPTMMASMSNTSDNSQRPLPVSWRQAASGTNNYFGKPPSAVVDIQRIDPQTVYLRADIIDIFGLSWLIANSILIFKFYCLREPVVKAP